MIINHGGKSYDTSNGEENYHQDSLADPNAEDRSGLDRWSDDGAEPRSPRSILKAVATRVTTRMLKGEIGGVADGRLVHRIYIRRGTCGSFDLIELTKVSFDPQYCQQAVARRIEERGVPLIAGQPLLQELAPSKCLG